MMQIRPAWLTGSALYIPDSRGFRGNHSSAPLSIEHHCQGKAGDEMPLCLSTPVCTSAAAFN